MCFLSGEKATAEFNIDLSVPREGVTSGWSKATKQILEIVVGENFTKKGVAARWFGDTKTRLLQ